VTRNEVAYPSRPFTCGRLRWFLFGRALVRGRFLGFVFRPGLLLVAQALLERSHEIDDVRALGGRRVGVRVLDDLLALGLLLLLDQAMERIDIAVVEFVSLELDCFALDQHRCHVEQVLIGIGVAYVAE
jgi:hypothetical protein